MHRSFADVNHRALLGLSLMCKREEGERGRKTGIEREREVENTRNGGYLILTENSYGRTASTKTPKEKQL